MKKIAIALIAWIIAISGHAANDLPPPMVEALEKAIDGDLRSEKDRARDANRRPLDTLKFFGVRSNMRVLELLPGEGWYTKILGPYLQHGGELSVAIGTQRIEKRIEKWGLSKVRILAKDTKFDLSGGRGFFSLNKVKLPVNYFDAIVTFRNAHNFGAPSRKMLNKVLFKSLTSGGIYAIVSHTKRHMEPFNKETWRRVDPVQLIKEVQEAGFIFEDYSDIHYRPDDELRYDTTRPSINRNSDRFTLKFIKP